MSEGKKKEEVSKKPYVVKYGLNHVVGLIENKKAALVLIPNDVDPIELVIFLPALCRKMGVPYAMIKGKARLGTVVHKKVNLIHSPTQANIIPLFNPLTASLSPYRLLPSLPSQKCAQKTSPSSQSLSLLLKRATRRNTKKLSVTGAEGSWDKRPLPRRRRSGRRWRVRSRSRELQLLLYL